MNTPHATPIPRLTSLSHGGGCGCKIAPGVLQKILTQTDHPLLPKQLLVGIETSDDAAVYQINDTQAIVATTDFFMPIVDDPYDFGRIAATNAISDIYAMGATPLFALALVGMPINTLPLETIKKILDGGEAACRQAGIPIAGGHSIDSVEPIYGLVAIGLVDPRQIKRNNRAQPGDQLILGKPLGVGILSAALKKEKLDAAGYCAMIASTTQLNTPGIKLGEMPGVHALTDVTGFGLLGHLLEICRGSQVAASLDYRRLPFIDGVQDLARQGCITGASNRNWTSYGNEINLSHDLENIAQSLLTDPQTSGGLLVACDPTISDEVLALFHRQGFSHAARIGEITAGTPAINVRY
ncbi:MAG: selenide, water dikinase SelD [Betaproteobacteria bacterium]|nr:selenide, water dikinase SelD [Betaproteobacteria bacterium]